MTVQISAGRRLAALRVTHPEQWRATVRGALEAELMNICRAARRLGVAERTMFRWLGDDPSLRPQIDTRCYSAGCTSHPKYRMLADGASTGLAACGDHAAEWVAERSGRAIMAIGGSHAQMEAGHR